MDFRISSKDTELFVLNKLPLGSLNSVPNGSACLAAYHLLYSEWLTRHRSAHLANRKLIMHINFCTFLVINFITCSSVRDTGPGVCVWVCEGVGGWMGVYLYCVCVAVVQLVEDIFTHTCHSCCNWLCVCQVCKGGPANCRVWNIN